jgi:hypothetical protein
MTTPDIAINGTVASLSDGSTSLDISGRLAQLLGHKPLIFVYNLIALGVLCALMVLYFQDRLPFLPEGMRGLPAYAIWFGALGGVVVSMKHVYTPETPEGQAVWYFGRPFSGAIVGGMTFVLLQALTPNSPPSAPIVQAAAFIVGIQEKRFFDLLFRVADVVLATPGDKDASNATDKNAAPPQPPTTAPSS